jgi:hypothetical protein
MFGTSIATTDDSTTREMIVPYTYQVETTVGVLDSRTLAGALLSLEYAMTEGMIPLLLQEECSSNSSSSKNDVGVGVVRSATLKGGLSSVKITGISVAPPDEIEPDKMCRSDDAGSGLCFVMDGQLTINYHSLTSSEPADEQQLSDSVRQHVYQEIQSGQFNSGTVDPVITRVGLYVDESADESPPGGNDNGNGGGDGGSTLMFDQNTRKPLIGSLVGVFATVTVFVTILIRRQMSIRRGRAG